MKTKDSNVNCIPIEKEYDSRRSIWLPEEEKIEVEESEVDRELELLSLQMREPLDTLRQRLTEDGSLARIREQIRREKTGSLLYEKLAS